MESLTDAFLVLLVKVQAWFRHRSLLIISCLYSISRHSSHISHTKMRNPEGLLADAKNSIWAFYGVADKSAMPDMTAMPETKNQRFTTKFALPELFACNRFTLPGD